MTDYSHVIRHRADPLRALRRLDLPTRIAAAIALAATIAAALVPLALT